MDFFVLFVLFLTVLAAPVLSVYLYAGKILPSACAITPYAGSSGFIALAYYAHLVPIAVLVVIAGFVFASSHERKVKKIFSLFVLAFSLWLSGNLITLVSENPLLLHAVRLVLGFLEIAFFVLAAYFVALFSFSGRPPFWIRFLLLAILLVPIGLVFQGGFTLETLRTLCNPLQEGYLAVYRLGAEAVVLTLITYSWMLLPQATIPKKPFHAMTASLFLFLSIFALSSFFASLTAHYEILLYGLLALPIFIIVLVYAISNLELFKMESFGVQVLLYLILLIISSLFLLTDSGTGRFLIGITLLLAAAFGYLFQQGALREVSQRHSIQKLAEELEDSNARQEKLIHFIGHEVKGFLAKDQSTFAALAEGDGGTLPGAATALAENALLETRTAVRVVTDILAAANLKRGTLALQVAAVDLEKLIAEVVKKTRPAAEGKGLTLSLTVDSQDRPYSITADAGQLADHVFRNLVENAVNYTPSGSVDIFLKKAPSTTLGAGNKVIFSVKDTGVGITEEDKKRLFTEGGHGRDSQRVNAHSTGYGLYIAKQIVEAHGGTIRAESEGQGTGSTFIVELPA
ncbi:MAG: Histidine kinase-, DNA gyrase B-, and [Parcubacteria group bacterium GW2011_GWB1_57_6]|nr:MAG: Histidine kinase-, DNA gyrase B-, and [Parcubacteria group bacterium GW2011_GWA1_56_13]KKW46626.1 MAG: Histidine kinase-, DNA gyrase B-, and [Parcubacteria group bacterium GW2011_GWB1_57_6]